MGREIGRGARRDPERLEFNPYQVYLTHQAAIERAIATVARRYRLSTQDAAELAGEVRLRLLEGDCKVLRQFKGESGIHTFLAVVVGRILLDQRTATWGRWRPSKAAQRMGTMAIRMERLIAREGLSVDHACETLRINHRLAEPRGQLEALAARLPSRAPRRMVGDGELAAWRTETPSPEEALLRAHASRALTILQHALAALSPGDRLLIRLRFLDQKPVSEIARLCGLEPKPLYRKFEALLRRLRGELRQAGLESGEVLPWLGQLEQRPDAGGA
jgi:RNA polymerase sigma factor (sigma-70 family)